MYYVYLLKTYEYNSYTYNGLQDNESYVFVSRESAERWAIENNLTVYEDAETDRHCTIEMKEIRA